MSSEMAKFALRQFRFIDAGKHFLQGVVPQRVLESQIFRVVRSWVFQGALYMDWRELSFRLTLEVLLAAMLWFVFQLIMDTSPALVASVFMSHTVMWVLNGHLWALSLGEGRRVARNRPDGVLQYLQGLNERMTRARAVKACVIFGSLSRGQFTADSDLDIWCVSYGGVINHLIAFSVGVRERSIAAFAMMPIELYFYDVSRFVGADAGERPVLIKDESGEIGLRLSEAMPYRSYPFDEQTFFGPPPSDSDEMH